MIGMNLGNMYMHIIGNNTSAMAALKGVEAQMLLTTNRVVALGRKMTLGLTLPLAAIGLAATKAFADFDDAMTRSTSIMVGLSADMRKSMEDLAISLSKQGVKSATDLAESYFFLASAGLTAEQSLAALPGVLSFATAGAFDMATATDLLTDAQSALGMKTEDAQQNMLNMVKISDILVKGNVLANASVQQFSESLTTQAGPAMKAYRVQLEQGVSVLLAYADQGLKAGQSGVMFSRLLRLMSDSFDRNKEAWDALGITLYDQEGRWRDFSDIFGELSAHFDSIAVEDFTAGLKELGFQAKTAQVILPLLGTQDAMKKYAEMLAEAGGITERVAKYQMTSLTSALKVMWHNITAVGISIGRHLRGPVETLSDGIIMLTRAWESLSDQAQASIV